MCAHLAKVMLVIACGIAATTSASAEKAIKCTRPWPEPFAASQSFVLDDPRSGLAIHVESDGRHLSALTREGKVIWHRDIFNDSRLERIFPPPPQIPGQPSISNEQWARRMHGYVAHLSIDRISAVPDCMVQIVDHDYPAPLKGHYILAGSGTHIFWLLDAKTGDLKVEQIN